MTEKFHKSLILCKVALREIRGRATMEQIFGPGFSRQIQRKEANIPIVKLFLGTEDVFRNGRELFYVKEF